MSLQQILHAPGPDPARSEQLGLYAFLVGEWRIRVIAHQAGARHEGEGRIDAGWVLGGRAIQDVWQITSDPLPIAGKWFGTTLRLFDPALAGWRILWSDPGSHRYYDQVGRADADGIEQLGAGRDGSRSRWTFRDIAPASFHWRAEAASDPLAPWTLLVDVFATRV
jgi:hypothetical protein